MVKKVEVDSRNKGLNHRMVVLVTEEEAQWLAQRSEETMAPQSAIIRLALKMLRASLETK